MRTQARIFGIVLCALAAAACSGDGDETPGTGGSGGTGGTGGTGGGAQTATVAGLVSTWDGVGTVVEGATVGVFGTQISATSDEFGEFILENVPYGDVFFTTTKSGNWGIVDYYFVPDETNEIIGLGVIPDSEFADWETELGRTIPETDGAVDIVFYAGAAGGETGAINPAGGDPTFTFDLFGDPVEQTQIIADEGFGELVFTSVDPANGPIGATVTGVSGVTLCEVDESLGTTYPIIAKSLTIVYANCVAE